MRKKYESNRQLERQSHILATARAMLSELGYSRTTMRNLAERAGVVPATLYNLYGGKDELFLAALDSLLDELRVEALASNPQPGVDAILSLVASSGRTSGASPGYAEALARSLFNLKRDDPAVDALYARARPFFLEHMKKAQSQGQLVPGVEIEIISDHLVGQGWSVIWSWLMGLTERANLAREYERSYLMTLISVTTGETNARLRSRFDQLVVQTNRISTP